MTTQAREVIEDDVACLRCAYNLRGLGTERNCPECGEAVQTSVRPGRLSLACGKWLGDVFAGLYVALLGIVGMLLLPIGLGIALITDRFATCPDAGILSAGFGAITSIAGCLLFVIAVSFCFGKSELLSGDALAESTRGRTVLAARLLLIAPAGVLVSAIVTINLRGVAEIEGALTAVLVVAVTHYYPRWLGVLLHRSGAISTSRRNWTVPARWASALAAIIAIVAYLGIRFRFAFSDGFAITMAVGVALVLFVWMLATLQTMRAVERAQLEQWGRSRRLGSAAIRRVDGQGQV